MVDSSGEAIDDTLDEVAELDRSGMRTWPLDELLREFAAERAAHVSLYSRLTGLELQRNGIHSSIGSISVANVISQAAYHDLLHVQQLGATLAASPDRGRGAFRIYG